MRIRLPTPLNGWRAYSGEVSTIVLGVLIALGAQEFVQSLHWKREVQETRKSLDAELARDLAAYQYRVAQRQCVDARLHELEHWAASLRKGRPLRLNKGIDAPPGFEVRTAAWEVTDGEIAARIPIKAKMAYAGMYDAVRTFDEVSDREGEQWSKLIEMQSSTTFAETDLRAIEQAIRMIRGVNQAVPAFSAIIDPLTKELGLRPEANIEGTADPIMAEWRAAVCKPLFDR